jgi:hypothetical protein
MDIFFNGITPLTKTGASHTPNSEMASFYRLPSHTAGESKMITASE